MQQIHILVGGLIIDVYTAPGFIMAIAWILYQFFMLFTYYDPKDIGLAEADGKDVKSNDDEEEKIKLIGCEEKDLPDTETIQDGSCAINDTSIKLDEDTQERHVIFKKFQRYYNEFIADNIIVCLSMFFLTLFLQTNSETVVTPLMETFFHFGTLENSIFFFAMGALGFLVCVFLGLLGKRKVDDRYLILIGLTFMTTSAVFSLIVFPTGAFGQEHLLGFFIAIMFVYMVGHTSVLITNFSLYSKLVSNECMGFGMGLKRSVDIVGMILGPLWSGALVHNLYILY